MTVLYALIQYPSVLVPARLENYTNWDGFSQQQSENGYAIPLINYLFEQHFPEQNCKHSTEKEDIVAE